EGGRGGRDGGRGGRRGGDAGGVREGARTRRAARRGACDRRRADRDLAPTARARAGDLADVRCRARGVRGRAAAAMIWAIPIGAVAGLLAGMLGVGGGVLFVPGLVLLVGLTQHEAEATSLLAFIPVALAVPYCQER